MIAGDYALSIPLTKYQRELWDAHAARLGLSTEEYVLRAVRDFQDAPSREDYERLELAARNAEAAAIEWLTIIRASKGDNP